MPTVQCEQWLRTPGKTHELVRVLVIPCTRRFSCCASNFVEEDVAVALEDDDNEFWNGNAEHHT